LVPRTGPGVTKLSAEGCTDGAAGGSCGLVERATSARASIVEGERLCPRGFSDGCGAVGRGTRVEGAD
jgi:hypothetical protein